MILQPRLSGKRSLPCLRLTNRHRYAAAVLSNVNLCPFSDFNGYLITLSALARTFGGILTILDFRFPILDSKFIG
jgi:hypothetical protein